MSKWAAKEPVGELTFLLDELASSDPGRRIAAGKRIKTMFASLPDEEKEKVVASSARLVAENNFSAIVVLGAGGSASLPFLPLLTGVVDKYPALKRMALFQDAIANIINSAALTQIIKSSAIANIENWKKNKKIIVPGAHILVKLKNGAFARGKLGKIAFNIVRQREKEIAVPEFHLLLDGGIQTRMNLLFPHGEMWITKPAPLAPSWAATYDTDVVRKFGESEKTVKGVIIGNADRVSLLKIKAGGRIWIAQFPEETLVPCSPPEWGLGIASRLTPLTEGDVVEIEGGQGDLFVVHAFRDGSVVLDGIKKSGSGRLIFRSQVLKYIGRYDAYRGVRIGAS